MAPNCIYFSSNGFRIWRVHSLTVPCTVQVQWLRFACFVARHNLPAIMSSWNLWYLWQIILNWIGLNWFEFIVIQLNRNKRPSQSWWPCKQGSLSSGVNKHDLLRKMHKCPKVENLSQISLAPGEELHCMLPHLSTDIVRDTDHCRLIEGKRHLESWHGIYSIIGKEIMRSFELDFIIFCMKLLNQACVKSQRPVDLYSSAHIWKIMMV